MRTAMTLAMLLCLAACDHEEPAGGYVVYPVPPGRVGAATLAPRAASTSNRASDATRIQVLPDKRANRPAEVLGVVDAHVAQGDEEAALAVLRGKAAMLGADAVLGVDLQHGDGHKGEPIHLSGLAVRYLDRPVAGVE